MRWILGLSLALVTSVAAVGIAAWLAISYAVFFAGKLAAPVLETARASVEAALPDDLTADEVRRQLDGAVAALRAGRVDGAALRDAMAWLPGALLDGEIDAAEGAALWEKLQRIVPADPAARDA